jgi:predicted nucleic acid-binding protein
MGVDALADVPSGTVLVVDTAPIIYFLEDHRTLAGRYQALFERAAQGEVAIAISAITVAEVLSGPAAGGNEVLLESYRAALTQSPGWSVIDVSERVAVAAARFRAAYRLKLPDALQLATAVAIGAYGLVTHDRDFRAVKDVRIFS